MVEKKQPQKAEEKKKVTKKKTTKKTAAKPLPVDKEKTKEIEEQIRKEKAQTPETTTQKGTPKEQSPEKTEEPKKEKQDKKKEEPKITKKEEAVAHGQNLPISKKHSMYLCSFIKNKKIDDAIEDLQKVTKMKKAIPFKGEIPHRKGDMERGRYPVKAAKHFINLLKGLKGNVITNQMELEETKIYIASASWANRPMRRGGRLAKRTNVTLKAKEFPEKQGGKK